MEMLCILVLLATSYWYFKTAPAGTPAALRLIASAHGASSLLLLLLALAIAFSDWHREAGVQLFTWLQLLPFILVALSFWLFRGPKALHWLQLLNVPASLWIAFIGGMLVSGKWL